MYRRTGAYDGGGAPEMVDVQLITPAAVGGVLRPYRLTQPRANRRLLPGLAPQPAAQPGHGGGGGGAGGVGAARQGRERRLERAFRGRGRQERADDREAQMRPSVVPPSRALVARHRAAASWRPVIGRPPSMARSDGIGWAPARRILCGSAASLAERARRRRRQRAAEAPGGHGLTPRSACRRDPRQGVGPWRSTQASRTTAPR